MTNAHRAQAELEESLVSLFAGRPELCGFTVALDGALILSDVGVFPPGSPEDVKLLCEEIRYALAELMDTQPEARRLLAGRTFARILH
jgi:hypothetical protein